jgi:hypothetical protein
MNNTTASAINPLTYIYAIGSLRPYLATRDLQKEFEAAAVELQLPKDDFYGVFSHSSTANPLDVLTFRPYLYIAEKASWVFSINNVDTYILLPKYKNELDALIDALRQPPPYQKVAIIGTLGSSFAKNEVNALNLPTAVCNNIVCLPKEEAMPFMLKANDGLSAAHRAVNFVVVNFDALALSQSDVKGVLTDINFKHYSKEGRVLIEIILTYASQELEVFYSCGIDVTDEYPFIDFPLRNFLPQTA